MLQVETTTIMNTPPPNTSINFNLLFDLTVDKSIDLISTTFRQVFQLLICFAVLFVIGKLSSYLNFVSTTCSESENDSNENENEIISADQVDDDSKSTSTSIDKESTTPPISDLEQEKIENIGKSFDLTSNAVGWESEQLQDSHNQPEHHVKNKYLQAKTINKQLKRKCMSVGPIMLTPNSQLIRCLDAEDREERYTYKTCDTLIASTDRVDVCVPQMYTLFISVDFIYIYF